MSAWTIPPADPPAPGAGLHLVLTPPEPVGDLCDLTPAARDGLWDTLRAVRDRWGLPGYSWAVRHGETVVHVVAGGKAALELTRRETPLGPNDRLPCGTPSARKRHIAQGRDCDVCGTDNVRVPGDQPLERAEAAA